MTEQKTPRTTAQHDVLLICSPVYAFEKMTEHALDLETELQAMTSERDQLRTQLEAWHHVFGTTQLTHAEAKLTAALAAIKRRDEVITRLVAKVNEDQEYDEHHCPNGNPCGICRLVTEAKELVAAKLKEAT